MVKFTAQPDVGEVLPPTCPHCSATLDVMHVVQHWEFMGRCRDVLACPSCGTTLGYAIPRPGEKLPCYSAESTCAAS